MTHVTNFNVTWTGISSYNLDHCWCAVPVCDGEGGIALHGTSEILGTSRRFCDMLRQNVSLQINLQCLFQVSLRQKYYDETYQ